jgi:glycosyltransferase involved in cell wall biosynthesis
MRHRISVLHEGVDTDLARPRRAATFKLPGTDRVLTQEDRVVTYVARNLEPYRGFHIFMRSLPQVLRRCPHARVVILGGDGVSYGAPSPPRTTFRDMMLQEVGAELDLDRVHFVGTLEYVDYLTLLQVSSVHVYLTYPFVLSWSFIEALSTGCVIVGSATPPVLEGLRDGENGLTVDFFAPRALADRIESVLEQPAGMQRIRDAARATALEHFDLNRVLLPRWEALFDDLCNHRRPKES